MKRWSWRWFNKRKGHNAIVLYFDDREIANFGWFPPWQGPLMRDNAKYLVRVLNAAFALGPDAADHIEELAKSMIAQKLQESQP